MIVAGFGCRAGADTASLRAAFAQAQAGHPPVTLLAAPADRIALLGPLADTLGLAVVALSPAGLRAIVTPTQSPASLAARATGSVAEAAALAAAGPGARLLAHRHIAPDRMATCALAEGSRS